jgi:hypothetical protein
MVRRVREILALADQIGDEELRAWGPWLGIWSTLHMGDLPACDAFLADISRQRWWLKQPFWSSSRNQVRHLRAMLAGDLELAERALADFVDTSLGHWGVEGLQGLLTFLLRREQGRLGSVAPALRALVSMQPEGSFWRPGLVALYVELGMLGEARDEFERLVAGGFAVVPGGSGEIALGLAAEACAALGDAERAGEFFGFLSTCRGMLLVTASQACLGPVDRLLALLAATAGRFDEAEQLFNEAIDFCRRMPSPLWLAHCLHDAAGHLPELDRQEARAMQAEAAELCERHHLAGLAQKLAVAKNTLGL